MTQLNNEAFSEELCLFRKYAFEFGQSNDMEAYELMMKCQVNLHALYEAAKADSEREGWVSVPIEPTEEMIDAAFVFLKDGGVENIDGDDIRGAIRHANYSAPKE